MENSGISWTDNTFNPWWGCTKVSEACKFCYAETLDNRWNKEDPHWGPGSTRKPMSEKYWDAPLNWNRLAELAGKKTKVFCASMADVFEDHPEVHEHRMRLFNLIEKTPHLIWQLLTKRPENIKEFTPVWHKLGFPDNVWIGTSVENQAAADLRIPILLQVPCKVRFLSCEPLLGKLYFGNLPDSEYPGVGINCLTGDLTVPVNHKSVRFVSLVNPRIHWVIVGGESGNSNNIRHMELPWVLHIKHQCEEANVPFFFKQWGEYVPISQIKYLNKKPDGHYIDDNASYHRIGKTMSGNLLDGVEHLNFPNYEY